MQILQLSAATPKNRYSTTELIESFPCQIPESVKQKILNLGVTSRHLINHGVSNSKLDVLDETHVVDLCVNACKDSVEKAGLSIEDIGFFIVAYDVNPILCPGLSQLLVRKVGLGPYVKHVGIQGMACTAFTKALELAENHLAVYPNDFVLLCISGVNSYWFYNQVQGLKNIIDIGEISSIQNIETRFMELRKWIATMEFFLFGDGVASLVIGKKGNGLSINRIVEVTNFRENDYLAGYARLAALNEPFKFGFYSYLDKNIPELGADYVSLVLERMFGKNVEASLKEVKKLAVHTGSEKILSLIARRYGVGRAKLLESYEVLRDCGNLAGASLPFILERIVSENRFEEGDRILSIGYGWGFSASACLLEFRG